MTFRPGVRAGLLALALACSACAGLSPAQRERATQLVADARATTTVACAAADHCARPSPLHALAGRAFAETTPASPRHYAVILDRGHDALLARVDLMRSATTSIDLQTYIFDEDDAGRLVLDELLAAARRGVRVRVLVDQLSALKRVDTLAALSGAHANFEIRIYNPVLGRAHISYPQYVWAAMCCWRKLNQRMHTKLLVVDGAVGITGGRNYQDDYYDWSQTYNFRDRDVLVAGPAARSMERTFDTFWVDPHSRPAETLSDVGRALLSGGVPALPPDAWEVPARVAALSREADDPAATDRIAATAFAVAQVDFLADAPQKHAEEAASHAAATQGLRALIESAQQRVMLQTPYLVLSDPAQAMFRGLRARAQPPRIEVSTSSLASIDSFITYALSYKYLRRYLRDFGFEIHEYKPFPATGPFDYAWLAQLPPPPAPPSAPPLSGTRPRVGPDYGKPPRPPGVVEQTGAPRALGREENALGHLGRGANKPVELLREGLRTGLHAKSMVIDDRVGVIGTHNFDPRSDHYNTEAAVVVHDPAFARALAASIHGDMAPGNAWTIAPREKPPVLPGVEYSLEKVSSSLPIFDLWPVRYATDYEFQPGPECPQPLSPFDPNFRACYVSVGDFPEVKGSWKALMTRIFTAFGSGLAPIL